MKRYFWALILIGAFLFSGCQAPLEATEDSAELNVISTTFPGYDFARAVIGDKGTVTMLLSPGEDTHSFDPTPADIIDVENSDLSRYYDELGCTLGEALLTPTKIYVKPVLSLCEQVEVKGISHITGGGFYENIPRSIPAGLGAKIEKSAVKVLPIFDLIQKAGNIPERDMFNTFNMGVGMSIVVAEEDAEKAMGILRSAGEEPFCIGEITASGEGVTLW